MRALLDTHAFLWWNARDPKLSIVAYNFIANPENTVLFSVASAWEIIIKHSLGKLSLPEVAETYIPSRIEHYNFQPLPVELDHVLRLAQLEAHHNDPFDRLLIVQSLIEDVPIITVDQKIRQYPVKILW